MKFGRMQIAAVGVGLVALGAGALAQETLTATNAATATTTTTVTTTRSSSVAQPLPEVSPVPEIIADCSPEWTQAAQVGDVCLVITDTGEMIQWRVEADGAVRDLKSGILVSKRLGTSTQYNAQELCPAGMHLPSGYPLGWKGEISGSPSGKCAYGEKDHRGHCYFPNQASEWMVLDNDGIREVIAMSGDWYWSSSVHPSYSDDAFDFDGGNGDVGSGGRIFSYGSVRCVSGR